MKVSVLPGIYAVFFMMASLIPGYQTIFFAALILTNGVFLLLLPQNKDWVLFSTALIGNEFLALTNIIVFIIISLFRKPVKLNKIKKKTLLVLSVIVFSSLISAFIYSTIWNLIFYIAYLCILAFTYKFSELDISSEKMSVIIKFFVVLEFASTLIIAVTRRTLTPGDFFGGTIFNAHYFANWLVLTLFALISISVIYEKKTLLKAIYTNLVYILMIVFMIYLASANTVVIAAIIAVVLYLILNPYKKSRRNDLFWMIIITYIGFFCILGVLNLEPVKLYLSEKSQFLRLYLYSPGWNYKLKYFHGTLFDSLKGFRIFTGYGLGQYGSRIANAFAYDTMWRADNGINNIISSLFPAGCIPEYARYISFYTQDFVNGILWRSAVMSYPFSSFIALIAETGVVGVGFVAHWINKTFKNCNCKILIYYFLIVCIFDIYFDDYLCVLVLILYIASFMGFEGKRKIE